MRYLLLIALLIPGMVAADEFAPLFQWTGPTEFVSGRALDPDTDLSAYKLYCPVGPTVATQTLPNTDNTFQAPFGMFPAGNYECYMTAVDLAGGESDPSNTKAFPVLADRPGPVVIFEVN